MTQFRFHGNVNHKREEHCQRVFQCLKKRALVMGILNITPDSFSDGGQFHRASEAVRHAVQMAAAGADMVDIGGESTRPGGQPVSAEDELRRVIPVLEALPTGFDTPVSIDTYKAEVAEMALTRGASFINDVWGLQCDAEMAPLAARTHAGVIAMHNRTEINERVDILSDMKTFFNKTLQIARRAGVAEDRIVLDPGIGFGKSLDQNLTVLANLDQLQAFGKPLLMGLSRKSFLGKLLGAPVHARLTGTLVANLWSLMEGVDIIRVHDVPEHVAALDVLGCRSKSGR